MISIEHNWMKTEAQIRFLQKISKTLDPEYCDVQSRVLSELEGKLKTATLTMDQLILHSKENEKEKDAKAKEERQWDLKGMGKALEKMAPMKKVKYAFKKESLEGIRDDLESWQRRFDPSWMLTMLITDKIVDEQLEQEEKKPAAQKTKFIMAAKGVRDAARESLSGSRPMDGSIFRPIEILSTEETSIPFSSTILCRLEESKEQVLVDTMICNPIADMNRTLRDVRKLAQILSKVDPSTFGLLVCTGVVKSSIPYSFDQPSPESPQGELENKELPIFKFLFSIPFTLSTPKSLRFLLLESNPSYSLNSRYDLAKQIASSVMYIHSSQFVHKNIRPETTIIFEKDGDEESELGGCYLVGFENFRPAEGMTYRTSDGIWQHDLCMCFHSRLLCRDSCGWRRLTTHRPTPLPPRHTTRRRIPDAA
jgi:serine/threonine protein kinase